MSKYQTWQQKWFGFKFKLLNAFTNLLNITFIWIVKQKLGRPSPGALTPQMDIGVKAALLNPANQGNVIFEW